MQVDGKGFFGIESLRKNIEISYTPELSQKPDLYLVTLSVSDYKDDRYDLAFAKKDGLDIVNLFADNFSDYRKVHLDTLFDNNVTHENFELIKTSLMGSRVDDQVVIFVSGHGLLDDNFDFYFASYNMDFRYI